MRNVISPAHTPDPFVVFDAEAGTYYGVRSKIEASNDNLDPPGWSCWHAAQDQVIITRATRLEDIFTSPDASAVIIDRSSPMGGSWGGVSVGAFAVTYSNGAPCPSPGFWAPSMKRINGNWYLFVTGHRPDVQGEANFIMECDGADPLDVNAWHYRGMLNHSLPGLDGEPVVLPTNDPLAANVTLQENGKTIRGQLYYVYSHNERTAGNAQQLHLVRLVWDVDTRFTEYDVDRQTELEFRKSWSVRGEAPISTPMFDWELQPCTGCSFGVNEGPTALYGYNSTYIMYSASFCATKFYSIGLLEFQGNAKSEFPFVWAKYPRPIFSGDVFDATTGKLNKDVVSEQAFGVGHNSVTVSPDLSEHWIVYHGKTALEEGPGDREARVQRFWWSSINGGPDFGSKHPSPAGSFIRKPSSAKLYALVCSDTNYTGRTCVGLPPGRYSSTDLIEAGLPFDAIRSIKLSFFESLSVYVYEVGRERKFWVSNKDVAVVPYWVHGARLEWLEVVHTPPHDPHSSKVWMIVRLGEVCAIVLAFGLFFASMYLT